MGVVNEPHTLASGIRDKKNTVKVGIVRYASIEAEPTASGFETKVGASSVQTALVHDGRPGGVEDWFGQFAKSMQT